MEHWELIAYFFIVSLIYSVAGFGGRTSYTIVLGLCAIPSKEVHLISIVCNIIVVTGSAIVYIRKYQIDWKKVIPLVAISIPFSYFGANLHITHNNLFLVLGVNLVIVSTLLWVRTKKQLIYIPKKRYRYSVLLDAVSGGYIGFLSSIIGIGGGVFIAAFLNFRQWDNPKKIATTTTLFILANSIFSLSKIYNQMPEQINGTRLALLGAAVLVGGQIGSRIGVNKLSLADMRKMTAAIIFLTGIQVLVFHYYLFEM